MDRREEEKEGGREEEENQGVAVENEMKEKGWKLEMPKYWDSGTRDEFYESEKGIYLTYSHPNIQINTSYTTTTVRPWSHG